jgi:hypothetical protein
MVIKRNISLKNIYLLFFTLLISCNGKFVNFDEYIKNTIFNAKEILDDKIYVIEKIKSEARITYTELGTLFRVYDSPNKDEMLFELKYWTKINPIEIININGNIWVKIETKDNRVGWIKSQYIEVEVSTN